MPVPFAEKVRRRLAELNLTQADLAQAVGTSQPQISTWLKAGTIPSSEYALKISKILKVSVEYLLDDSSDEPKGDGLDPAGQFVLQLVREVGGTTVLRQLVLRKADVSPELTDHLVRFEERYKANLAELTRRRREADHLRRTLRRIDSEMDFINREIIAVEHKTAQARAELGALETIQSDLYRRRDALDVARAECGRAINRQTLPPSSPTDCQVNAAPQRETTRERLLRKLGPKDQPAQNDGRGKAPRANAGIAHHLQEADKLIQRLESERQAERNGPAEANGAKGQ
jgi:transcriptional regulator with XRE-family HTH domain